MITNCQVSEFLSEFKVLKDLIMRAFKILLQFVVRTNDKFLQIVPEYITLNSPPTIIIDRYSIAALKTEYGCENSMHLFIDFFMWEPSFFE